jgi:hypothetical protein
MNDFSLANLHRFQTHVQNFYFSLFNFEFKANNKECSSYFVCDYNPPKNGTNIYLKNKIKQLLIQIQIF